MRWTCVAVVLAGCLEPSLVPCGELSCPAGTECIDGALCATADQVAACAALADGDPCQASGATGYCTHGACAANVCGDGAVTGNEVCDGADVPITCVDLGYYTGTPTCTAGCSIDRTGCTGRCGDGVVQDTEGEVCDGAPPAATCTDFGNDYGVLGCNHFCTPDIGGDCATYGWHNVLPKLPGSPLTAAAVNGHGALGLADQMVRIAWDGALSSRANPGWQKATADATRLIAAGGGSVGWFDGMAWHELPAGPSDVSAIALIGDVLYEVDDSCAIAAVDLAAGTSASVPSPTGTSCAFALAADGAMYVSTGAGVARWSGTAWTYPVAATDVTGLARAGGTLLVSHPTKVTGLDLATQQVPAIPAYPVSLYTQLAGDADGNIINHFHYIHSSTIGMFAGSTSLQVPAFPEPDTLGGIGVSADGDVFAFTRGIYTLSANAGAIDLTEAPQIVRALVPQSDGAVGVCGSQIGTIGHAFLSFATTSWGSATPTTGMVCIGLVGDPRALHFATGGSGLYRFDPVSRQYILEQPGSFSSLSGTTDDPWATAPAAVFHRTGGTWTSIPAPPDCSLLSGAGGGTAPFVAIASCPPAGSRSVLRLNGSTWTELASSTTDLLYTIAVSPDGGIFVGGDATFRVDNGQLVRMADASLGIVALAADDVYIGVKQGVVEHFVHGARASINVVGQLMAVTPSLLVTTDTDTQTYKLYGITRRPVRDAGRGL